jgi:putative transposase
MCRVMEIHPSGFYVCKQMSDSACAVKNSRLLRQIKHCWIQTGAAYGYRKLSDDLRDMSDTCGEQRVYRLMTSEEPRPQSRYLPRPRYFSGKSASVTRIDLL